MATIKTDLGYIHGVENLVDWVNKNAQEYHIKNCTDLNYWFSLAKQKKKEGKRCLTITPDKARDGKSHMLPFCLLRGEVTFHGVYH